MSPTDALTRILAWLRAGYPTGIPQTDYVALLGVLHRALTPQEVDSIAAELASRAASGVVIDEDDIRAMISGRAFESASPEDVHRVSAALARAGWPLSVLDTTAEPDQDAAAAAPRPSESTETPASDAGVVSRIVGWLREGYPSGVPERDYVPLLALLQRRLTKEEVKMVAKSLRRAEVSPAGPDDIAAAIEELIRTTPSEDDLHRVKDRLAKKGWPVDFPDPDSPARPHLVRT
ncbi:conserved hypothetical protein [Nostocoides japonicum T1-X7]|uniref:DUF3349 domain-containing protein n=1 Tax=Nostocoides japonicum T1-X7 TaxID=1194083 RepID=A0A077M1B8_9MICO|nr:DUF3349 domain-containing protein [Tetrasphaera japonica]CCH77990.1 conserved hypothetical protein [Tetrasphaera japonica T1-X7]